MNLRTRSPSFIRKYSSRLTLLACLAMFLALGCSSAGHSFGDSDDQPGICTVVPEICAFARSVEEPAQSGDFSSIVSAAFLRQYDCPASTPQGLGGPFPLCDAARAGERRYGFPLAYVPGEGIVIDNSALGRTLEGWSKSGLASRHDAFGSGETRLFTIGCPSEPRSCADNFALVFSNLGELSYRLEAVLFFETKDKQPRLVWAAIGGMTDMYGDDFLLTGGESREFLTYEGLPSLTTFHVVRR